MTKPVPENEAEGKVKEVYDDIRSTFGMVPNLFKVMAHDPEWLEENWHREKRIMLGDAAIDKQTRELIAMAVSIINKCDYCIHAHEAMARKAGASDEAIADARQVVDLFSSFNAIANAHPDLECDIKP